MEALKQRSNETDFFLTVKQLVKSIIGFIRDDERLYQVLNRNLEASEELKQQLIEIFPHSSSLGFDKLVRAALDDGQLDNRYSPEFISGVFEILMKHIHRLLPIDHPAHEIENVINQLIDLMQYGIAAKREDEL